MFVCIHVCIYFVLTVQEAYMKAYIDCESVYSSSLAVKQSSKTLRKIHSPGTFVLSLLTSSAVVIIVSLSSFSLEKNGFRSFDLTRWQST